MGELIVQLKISFKLWLHFPHYPIYYQFSSALKIYTRFYLKEKMADAKKIKPGRQQDFEVLARNQALMIRLGLSSDRMTESSNDFFKSFMPYFNLTFLSINLVFCAMVIVQEFPNLDLVLEPLIVFIGGMQGGGMFLSVGLNIENVKTLFLTVRKIVRDERK